nr:putative ribonuclease H-like domain-containing protein [Tanacetum cinerariifolium]
TKDETSDILKKFITEIENLKDLKVKIIRTPAIGFFKPFGCHVMILNTLDNLGKFEAKGDEGSGNPNLTTSTSNPSADQLETLTVESPIPTDSSPVPTACLNDSPEPFNEAIGVEADVSNMETSITASPTPTLRIHKDHPKSEIIGLVDTLIQTKHKSKVGEEQSFIPTIHQKRNLALLQFCLFSCFLSQVEPKKVLKNKKHERGIVIKNKARLVDQGHTQEEGIDYNEVFAHVARIEAIRLFLAYALFMEFIVYQMDVKGAFLYGTIDEEVYVMQPPGFHDPEFLAKVYKVEKVMYGLHQAPRAWYATSTTEAEYVAAASCYGQVLWIQNQLLDYGRVRITQSSALPTVADEPASLVRDVSKGEACPTNFGFIADQDRETIAKSSSLPHDSASRVTSPVTAEGSMQPNINELTVLCTNLQRQYSELLAKFQAQEVEIHKLKDRVKVSKDGEGVAATQSGDDAPIKGRSIDEGEAATERINDDLEELARVLTSMDADIVLAGGIDIPTGSGFIPTAGPPVGDIPTGSDDIPTASPVFATANVVTPYSRKKGKEVMVESDTLKKQRLQEQIDAQVARELEEQQEREDKRMTEQIARDVEMARIHVKEELQGMIDSLDRTNETIAMYIQEYQEFASALPLERRIELISDLVKYQDNYAKTYKFQSQQRKPRIKKQKKDFYMAVIRSNLGWKVKDFKGSKEEAERHKRKGIRFDQENSKKLKSSEEVIKDVKSTKEIPEEKMKEMMQLVPIEEVYVQAL